jgi:hypothetical protein
MSSFRQIEANRRNARLGTGPVTEDGQEKVAAKCASSWPDSRNRDRRAGRCRRLCGLRNGRDRRL